jgi:hypothetical protein
MLPPMGVLDLPGKAHTDSYSPFHNPSPALLRKHLTGGDGSMIPGGETRASWGPVSQLDSGWGRSVEAAMLGVLVLPVRTLP